MLSGVVFGVLLLISIYNGVYRLLAVLL